jgi:hypothetical protein
MWDFANTLKLRANPVALARIHPAWEPIGAAFEPSVYAVLMASRDPRL